MHNELYGIWYMENRQGQFIYVISGNQTEIHRAFWQIEKLCSRESPQKKSQKNLPKLQDFKEATPWVKYSIVHCQSKLVVGFVASFLETMTNFFINCPEIEIHTFWEGHKALTILQKILNFKSKVKCIWRFRHICVVFV